MSASDVMLNKSQRKGSSAIFPKSPMNGIFPISSEISPFSMSSAAPSLGETSVDMEVSLTSAADYDTIKTDVAEIIVMIASIVAIVLFIILFFIVVSPFHKYSVNVFSLTVAKL